MAKVGPDLNGKIHLIVGTAGTFYLDCSAHKHQTVLDSLHAKSNFRYLQGAPALISTRKAMKQCPAQEDRVGNVRHGASAAVVSQSASRITKLHKQRAAATERFPIFGSTMALPMPTRL